MLIMSKQEVENKVIKARGSTLVGFVLFIVIALASIALYKDTWSDMALWIATLSATALFIGAAYHCYGYSSDDNKDQAPWIS